MNNEKYYYTKRWSFFYVYFVFSFRSFGGWGPSSGKQTPLSFELVDTWYRIMQPNVVVVLFFSSNLYIVHSVSNSIYCLHSNKFNILDGCWYSADTVVSVVIRFTIQNWFGYAFTRFVTNNFDAMIKSPNHTPNNSKLHFVRI